MDRTWLRCMSSGHYRRLRLHFLLFSHLTLTFHTGPLFWIIKPVRLQFWSFSLPLAISC